MTHRTFTPSNFILRACFGFLTSSLILSPLAFCADKPTKPWHPTTYPISYWAGPTAKHTTPERIKEIADAHFTYCFPIYGPATVEDNKRLLDLAQANGLKAFIYDSRMSTSFSDAVAKGIDGMVADYAAHPALAGYLITDEPGAGAFPSIAKVHDYLAKKDPAHPGFVNLYPTYVRNTPGAMGTKTYEDYVRVYADTVRPAMISYDHYHFYANGSDGPEFFENLATVRKVSLEKDLPFWNIVQLTQWGVMRNLNEDELRFEAMQTLAYGGKALLWFTYWNPAEYDKTNAWSHSVINPDGSKDPHYDMVKHVNADVLAYGSVLLDATSTAVYHLGAVPAGASAAPKDAPITLAAPSDKSNLTVGLFSTPDRHTVAFLASPDYKHPLTTTLTLPANAPATLEQFNPTTRTWSPLSVTRSTLPLTLPPSGALLLRW